MRGRRLLVPVVAITLLTLGVVFAGGPSSLLPLGAPADENEEVPLPFGIGVTYYQQHQKYSLDKLDATSPDPAVNAMIQALAADVETLNIRNRTTEENLKVDVWVLPFLNVFGVIGNVDGDTSIVLMPPFPEIEVDYHGVVYGGGAILAGGWKQLFVSLTGTYTGTDLDEEDSTTYGWICQPRVGVRLAEEGDENNVSLWIGAMYQQVTETHEGDVDVPPLGPVTYDVKLEDDAPWNYLAGISVAIGRHWQLTAEAGFGERQNVELDATFRF